MSQERLTYSSRGSSCTATFTARSKFALHACQIFNRRSVVQRETQLLLAINPQSQFAIFENKTETRRVPTGRRVIDGRGRTLEKVWPFNSFETDKGTDRMLAPSHCVSVARRSFCDDWRSKVTRWRENRKQRDIHRNECKKRDPLHSTAFGIGC